MMKSVSMAGGLKAAAFAALIALAPAVASAFTVTPGATTIDERGTATGSIGLTGTTISMGWDDADGAGNGVFLYQAFTADEGFVLRLTSYGTASAESSRFNIFEGERTIGGDNSPFTLQSGEVDSSDVGSLTSVFPAGTYTLKFFETSDPNTGGATVEIIENTFGISEIPLPAGLVLMLSALGGLVAVRRRTA